MQLREASPVPFDIELDATEVEVSARAATANSLILHELLTNSVKYAFAKPITDEPPKVQIQIARRGQKVHVSYRDNGPGKDGKVRGTGKGSQLIDLFLEDLEADEVKPVNSEGRGFAISYVFDDLTATKHPLFTD